MTPRKTEPVSTTPINFKFDGMNITIIFVNDSISEKKGNKLNMTKFSKMFSDGETWCFLVAISMKESTLVRSSLKALSGRICARSRQSKMAC